MLLPHSVIPAKAGTHWEYEVKHSAAGTGAMGPGFRRDDEKKEDRVV